MSYNKDYEIYDLYKYGGCTIDDIMYELNVTKDTIISALNRMGVSLKNKSKYLLDHNIIDSIIDEYCESPLWHVKDIIEKYISYNINKFYVNNDISIKYMKLIKSHYHELFGKTCKKCKIIKDITCFHKHKGYPEGLHYLCNICSSERSYIYKKINRTKNGYYNEIKYRDNRKKINPLYKLIEIQRSRLCIFIKNTNYKKYKSTIEYLGCDSLTLGKHLQQTAIDNGYIDFNIYDYDATLYHIDHIIPYKAITDGNSTLDIVCHYKNLQILRWDKNLSKSGKY